MIELRGKYNTAKVFTDLIDSETIGQITNVLNQPFIKGSKIRIIKKTNKKSKTIKKNQILRRDNL